MLRHNKTSCLAVENSDDAQQEGGSDDDESRDEAGDGEIHRPPPPRLWRILLQRPLVMVDTSLSNPGEV